jgi:hypothetical protein
MITPIMVFIRGQSWNRAGRSSFLLL